MGRQIDELQARRQEALLKAGDCRHAGGWV